MRFRQFIAEQTEAFVADLDDTYANETAPFMQHLLSAACNRESALSAVDSFVDDSDNWKVVRVRVIDVIRELPDDKFPLKCCDLQEGLFRSKLVRGNHLVNMHRSNREGYKSLRNGMGGHREVRMSMVERMRRSRAARKGAIKRAPQMNQIQAKRRQNIERREKSGL